MSPARSPLDHETDVLIERLQQATAGEYDILGELGRGGMAAVYLAHDISLDRKVAIKVMFPSLIDSGSGAERFKREARTAASITHPNIIPIHAVRQDGSLFFFVMQFVEGSTLDSVLERQGSLSISMVQIILRQVGEALGFAHRQGVIHRDVKPANILLDQEGRAVVADFGIAKVAADQSLTQTGGVLGTPLYMSPEQCAGVEVTAASDQYSLGLIGYQMLTGDPPFTGEHAIQVMNQRMIMSPPPIVERRSDCPVALVEAVTRMIEREPHARWPTMEEAVAAIGDPGAEDRAAARQAMVHIAATSTPRLAGSPSPAARRPSRSHRLTREQVVKGGAMSLALAGALVLGLTQPWRGNRAVSVPTPEQITFEGNIVESAIAPDGTFLAFLSDDEDGTTLFVHDLASGTSVPLVTNPRALSALSWSPDAARVLVSSLDSTGRYRLRSYPRMGGPSVNLPGQNSFWSVDGAQLIGWGADGEFIRLLTPETQITTSLQVRDSVGWMRGVAQHPNADVFAIIQEDPGRQRTTIWRVVADSATRYSGAQIDSSVSRTVLFEVDGRLDSPRWSPMGDALYCLHQQGGTYDLWKVPTTDDGRPKGKPVKLLAGLEVFVGPVRHPAFSISQDGRRIFFTRGVAYSRVVAFEPTDEGWLATELTAGTETSKNPRFSADGQRIAYVGGPRGRGNVFVMPATGGTPIQLTFADSAYGDPVWSPDGMSIAFGVHGVGGPRVAMVAVDDPGQVRLFERTALSVNGRMAWAPGDDLLYQRKGIKNFHLLNRRTGNERPLLNPDSTGGFTLWVRYAPDGDRLAMTWNRRPDGGLYLLSLSTGEHTILLGGVLARPLGWSRDGETVFVHRAPRDLLSIRVADGKPVLMAKLPFDPSAGSTFDGSRFVFSVSGSIGDVWVIEDFDPER